MAAVLALMTLTGETRLEAALTLIAWGATSFGIGPILQQQQAAPAAPHSADIVSSLNISAFNLGIAVGAALGGRVVASSDVHAVTWVGAMVVSISVALASINALGTRCTQLAGTYGGRGDLLARGHPLDGHAGDHLVEALSHRLTCKGAHRPGASSLSRRRWTCWWAQPPIGPKSSTRILFDSWPS